MDFFEPNSLTIVISGPFASDVKLFMGADLISGIRKFRFYCSITEFIPEIEFTCALLSVDKTKKLPFEINDNDVIIYYKNAIDFSTGGLRTMGDVNIYKGHHVLQKLDSCELIADATLNDHSLCFEYNTATIVNGIVKYKDLASLYYCPWITVKAKYGLGTNYDDMEDLIKEAKFREILS